MLNRKFLCDFYFANFPFPSYSQGLNFANEICAVCKAYSNFLLATTLNSREFMNIREN